MARIPAIVGVASVLVALALAPAADAAEYHVGPSRPRTTLAQLFNNEALLPGDVVFVDAATYGAVTVPEDVTGTPELPIRIVGVRSQAGARPVLQGGANTIAFFSSDHVVLDGFEIRGGSARCVFLQADDVTIRDSVIHGCPLHGIHGADDGSGSFTLEYSEVYDAGTGQTKHPIYAQCDEFVYRACVLRLRHNHIHDGNGGNLLKSRFGRNEIHYNWFEGAAYQELELIGPDWETQHPAWTDPLVREDSDVVGNVIVHTGTWANAVRVGGDLNGHSMGRVRFVNNTVVFDTTTGGMRAVVVQLGLESLEMHNNAIWQRGGSAPKILHEIVSEDDPPWGTTAPWVGGRHVFGTHNWVETGATGVPAEWTQTRVGTDPGFIDATTRDYRIVATSPLRDAGGDAPTYAAFPFPSPLALPARWPPLHAAQAPGTAPVRDDPGATDIGAYSFAAPDPGLVLRDGYED